MGLSVDLDIAASKLGAVECLDGFELRLQGLELQVGVTAHRDTGTQTNRVKALVKAVVESRASH